MASTGPGTRGRTAAGQAASEASKNAGPALRRVALAGAPTPRREGTDGGGAVSPPEALRAGAGSTVERVADALKRSPLGLDLPSNHPGLANLASALVRANCGRRSAPQRAVCGRAAPCAPPRTAGRRGAPRAAPHAHWWGAPAARQTLTSPLPRTCPRTYPPAAGGG